jgi:hypothetical protein
MTRPIAPATLIRRQVVLEEHDPLPDGSGAVAVRRVVHGETYRSHLHLVRFGHGRGRGLAEAPRALTAGAVRDWHPRVSPEGRRVAFLRSFPEEPDRPAAVMIKALDGGEPWVLWAPAHGVSDLPWAPGHGIAEMAWSPDGRRMAYVAAAPDPRFIVGALLFWFGYVLNQHSDRVLINLRGDGQTGYKIPYGGGYRFVSCPNYLGEMVEWGGWALACWNPGALAFFVWTVANLAPRAIKTHRWYRESFPDYPPRRKALLPFIV